MKYAIVSDIHGNLEALETALKEIEREEVKYIFSAGDIVGYGANPEECIEMLRSKGIPSVIGNHDYAVNNVPEEELFNSYARLAIQWTRNTLSKKAKNFLSSLPFSVVKNDFTLFHGTLDKEGPFNYILMPADSELSFQNLTTRVGFFGHSHVAGCFIMGENGIISYRSGIIDCEIAIEEGNKYLINVGSVGQPRDGNPNGAFAIFDTDKRIVLIKRFAYNIVKTSKKIVDAGLPRFLAERLFEGV